MLEVVRRVDRVDRRVGDRPKIGDRGDDVGSDLRIEIDADLAPLWAAEPLMQTLRIGRSASNQRGPGAANRARLAGPSGPATRVNSASAGA